MEQAAQESNRDRVRRLLITPLEQAGMRAKRGADPARHRANLDRLCDEMAYLPDDGLAALRRWAEVNGDGARKDIWPSFVAFAKVAQAYQPRPVQELPEVARWFASRAGLEAMAQPGRLVAELRFIERHRRPPTMPGESERIARQAQTLATEVARARELRDCGRLFDEGALARFAADEARATAIVRAGQVKRGEAAE